MTLEDRVQAQRLFAFQRAAELGNASVACRELGLSRSLFYRWKQRVDRYGAPTCVETQAGAVGRRRFAPTSSGP